MAFQIEQPLSLTDPLIRVVRGSAWPWATAFGLRLQRSRSMTRCAHVISIPGPGKPRVAEKRSAALHRSGWSGASLPVTPPAGFQRRLWCARPDVWTPTCRPRNENKSCGFYWLRVLRPVRLRISQGGRRSNWRKAGSHLEGRSKNGPKRRLQGWAERESNTRLRRRLGAPRSGFDSGGLFRPFADLIEPRHFC